MIGPIWTGSTKDVTDDVLDLKNVIYKFTSPGGKAYVGQTIDLRQRFKKYKSLRKKDIGPAFYNALVKYGFENFELSVLASLASQSLLDRAEILAIWREKTLKPHGYNLNAGGNNAIPTEETREKMADKARNRSEETLKNMSDAAKRKWENMTEEEKAKSISHLSWGKGEDNPFYGKKHTEETRKKISEAQLGPNNHWRGKPKSLEWKLKLKASNRRNGVPVDEELPLYVSLLRREGREPMVRVTKPGHKVKHFGSSAPLSERIALAKTHLAALDAADAEAGLSSLP
jgi:group I intron endonuclease